MQCFGFGRKNVMSSIATRMYSMVRPLLFSMDAERAHALSLSALHCVPKSCFRQAEAKSVKALGLQFPHAVGLAAGLDKNGEHLDALAKLGFSFYRIGNSNTKTASR